MGLGPLRVLRPRRSVRQLVVGSRCSASKPSISRARVWSYGTSRPISGPRRIDVGWKRRQKVRRRFGGDRVRGHHVDDVTAGQVALDRERECPGRVPRVEIRPQLAGELTGVLRRLGGARDLVRYGRRVRDAQRHDLVAVPAVHRGCGRFVDLLGERVRVAPDERMRLVDGHVERRDRRGERTPSRAPMCSRRSRRARRPRRPAVSSATNVACVLVAKTSSGVPSDGRGIAARWTRPSGRAAAITPAINAGSPTSPTVHELTAVSRTAGRAILSTAATSCPRDASSATTWRPMLPPAPVTTIRIRRSSHDAASPVRTAGVERRSADAGRTRRGRVAGRDPDDRTGRSSRRRSRPSARRRRARSPMGRRSR